MGGASPVIPVVSQWPRRWEEWSPLVLSLLSAGACLVAAWLLPCPKDLKQLFASTIDLGAIAVGFLATVATVLLSLQASRMASRMRESGLWDKVMGFLISAIAGAFVLAGMSLLFVLADSYLAEQSIARKVCISVWAGAVVYLGGAAWRVLKIFFLIMRPTNATDLQG